MQIRKSLQKIIITIIIFSIVFILEKTFFGFLYQLTAEINFMESFRCSFSGTILDYIGTNKTILVCFITQSIIEAISFSVLTGYIYTYIVNMEPKLILPDKLVLRHRSNGTLTLGVLIGNKSNCNLYDVICTISCFYSKDNSEDSTNCEFYIEDKLPTVNGFYRFSFPVNKFPQKFLHDLITGRCQEIDSLTVVITGHKNYYGNNFRISKTYSLSDILIAENNPDILITKKVWLIKKDYRTLNKQAFQTVKDMPPYEKLRILRKIHFYIKQSS